MKKFWGISFLFFFALAGLGGGCPLAGLILLICAILSLPIKAIQVLKEKQLQTIYQKLTNKQPNLTYESYQKSNKIAFIIILCLCLVPIFAKMGEPSNNSVAPVAEKKIEYTQEQKDATIKLIEGLQNPEVGLIIKITENPTEPGYWDLTINEKVWGTLPYENKEHLQTACKIYGTIKSENPFKACIARGFYDGFVYFTDTSIPSKPMKF